jgi:hypothetical protein
METMYFNLEAAQARVAEIDGKIKSTQDDRKKGNSLIKVLRAERASIERLIRAATGQKAKPKSPAKSAAEGE